ncbi:putative transmembrane protein [Gregarina niphandrodes]|uniref:Transmembrane protein n=1 Tax=Gregarina niphandrodes TaxID=110365 RepID=A0A023B7H4_GRENI|nr:putative transmembrane protein [Gregarina niphandrodes]EZG67240.1 putative transmembrane protein [Gregarina niphandrodes]|eukprot:XP_011130285.1 putative transmembrane protein [Gregarina niphandrodes]
MWVATRHEGFDREGFLLNRPKVYTGFVAGSLDRCSKGFLRTGLLFQTLALLGMILFHYAFGGLGYYTWDLRHTTEEMRNNETYRLALLGFNILYFLGSILLTAFQAGLADDAAWSRGYRAGSKLLSYASFFDVVASTMQLAWALNFSSYYTDAMWTHFRDGNLDWVFCNGARVIRALAYVGYGLSFFLLEVYHDEGTNDWHGGANLIFYLLAGISEMSVILLADPAFSTAVSFVALMSALLWAVAFEEEVNASSPALNESELCNELEKQMDRFARVNPLNV